MYHVQSTSVSTTGERMAIFLLYVRACYRDIGCVAMYKRGMRCGAVYHVLFSAVCVMTQVWQARPLPYRRCTTPQSVSQTDSIKGQAGTLHSQVHNCRHQGRSTWLRALWLKIRKHSVSHTRLLRRKGEPITEFQNTASAPECDTNHCTNYGECQW